MSESGDCEKCGDHYGDGDGKECPACHRKLCYLHFPIPVGAPKDDAVCKRCAKNPEVRA